MYMTAVQDEISRLHNGIKAGGAVLSNGCCKIFGIEVTKSSFSPSPKEVDLE
jgi:hypothetical protein